MTGALDGTLRGLASQLSKDLGKLVTYVDGSGEVPETDIAATPPQGASAETFGSSLIEDGARSVGLPALDMPKAPTTSDRVKMDGATWQITKVDPLFSGDLVALYNVQLRR